MEHHYHIAYTAKNCYSENVREAFWQFLILPMENNTQNILRYKFENNLNVRYQDSINGLGFKTFRLNPKKSFKTVTFHFECELIKSEHNPFDFIPNLDIENEYRIMDSLLFRTENEVYLRRNQFSALPNVYKSIFLFDHSLTVFENLQNLNGWVYEYLYFKVGVTDVNTPLLSIIEKRQGVCQDFTHLFCAIAKENGVPSRYVSGYIHQGNNYFGDLQMHAWAEVLVPNIGWIGFDPTNNIVVAQNHIKVSHRKDYNDCAPLKGIVYSTGINETEYSVKVQSSQLQQ